ncbi:Rieske 2Fe-2S domain-containing protein [Hymenobacter sp. BT770]|uniref:Rieske 2Fe-2S domain-containing protein n=1 Tax=Hymenobacter sp. BT770 TaxID=2886942 RepID=UPI001D114B82|nr:Rieske 2Fe-2S domain-containing protein [Hymenobacter sp. BT770]MCC3153792.1 Rieske 2Fe-2S domain-containing protein [Hymenobacter sp. BT770]MDO3416926.1 Rieske 2Fe-2S domain-containing protein [Hymenobacter sp. BT770]
MSNSAEALLRRISRFMPLCSLLFVAACGDKVDDQPLIPYAPVNLSINITNQAYTALRYDNGAVTLPVKGPAGDGGVKGVIVVRQSAGTYLAFERNCPYRPYDACALVSLDRNSRLFMRDSCCNSQFDLRGQITGGPAPRPLKQYSTSLQGTLLNITN